MPPRVSLFITCLTDQFYPRVGQAVVKVLEHFGCAVDFPPAQTCCGQPMYNSGLHAQAADLARRMIRAFAASDYIVSPSGSCTAMIHDYYRSLIEKFGGDGPACDAFTQRSYEFSKFLLDVLKVDLRAAGCRFDGSATYHYSCHLRGLGMRDEAVRLLSQIDGLRYEPLEKTEQCCGFGGTFAVKFSEVSGSLARDKVDCVARNPAELLVCNDAGCTLNIAGMCHRQGVDKRIAHIAEIIAEGLGLLPRESATHHTATAATGATEPTR